jgi:hypothetical protein
MEQTGRTWRPVRASHRPLFRSRATPGCIDRPLVSPGGQGRPVAPTGGRECPARRRARNALVWRGFGPALRAIAANHGDVSGQARPLQILLSFTGQSGDQFDRDDAGRQSPQHRGVIPEPPPTSSTVSAPRNSSSCAMSAIMYGCEMALPVSDGQGIIPIAADADVGGTNSSRGMVAHGVQHARSRMPRLAQLPLHHRRRRSDGQSGII